MAKTIQQRLSAAKSPRARIADNEALIDDLKAEQDRLEAARNAAANESVDFALSETDRDEAAAKAGRLDRTIRALESEIATLAALTEEKRSDDARRAADAEKRAALAERDEIAAKFADRVPALTAELIEILKAVDVNADRMRLAGLHETNAEFHARGIAGNGMIGVSLAPLFGQMKIPDFATTGRAWPPVVKAYVDNYAERKRTATENEAREASEKAEAAQKFAREHGLYSLTVENSVEFGDAVVRIPDELVTGNIPGALGPWDQRELVINHELAKKLSTVPRLVVTCLDQEAA